MNTLLRQQQDPLFVKFVVASVVIHLSVALVADFWSRPSYTPPNSIEIELAPPSPLASADQGPPPAPPGETIADEPPPKPEAKAEAKPVVPPKPAADPVEPKKEAPAPPKPAPPSPKASAAPNPPKPTPQAEKVADKSPPKPSAKADTLSNVRKLLESKGATGAGAGQTSDGYALPTNVRGRLYFNQIETAVRTAWVIPPGVQRTPVEIDVTIGSNGKLLQRKIVSSSGNPLLDRSAMKALEIANIPAPPTDFKTPLRLILRLIPPEN